MTTQHIPERRAATRRVVPFLAATGISATGDEATEVAVPLLAATLTHDPFTLSLVATAGLLPWLIVGLHVGALSTAGPAAAR